MKTNFIKMCALGFGALTLFGCEQEDELMLDNQAALTQKAYAENCDAIDFNQYTASATFISEVHSVKGMGPVKVSNKARSSNGEMVNENRAVIFDLRNPTGDDEDDLYHPEYGNALIIQQLPNDMENNPIDEPNDNMWGGVMELDFSAIGPVTINTATVFDIDKYEDASFIRLFDASGKMIKEHKLAALGNRSVQVAEMHMDNVMRMEVMLAGTNGHVGSGAIDNIEFCVMPKQETGEVGCTRTQGYWKTHGDPKNQKKYNNTWEPYVGKTFYMSGMTYMEVLNEPVKGRAYFILAHQYIAAMLNMDAGASMPSEVKSAFDAATNHFKNNKPSDKKDPMHNQLTTWAGILDDYNNGKTGPGHCD